MWSKASSTSSNSRTCRRNLASASSPRMCAASAQVPGWRRTTEHPDLRPGTWVAAACRGRDVAGDSQNMCGGSTAAIRRMPGSSYRTARFSSTAMSGTSTRPVVAPASTHHGRFNASPEHGSTATSRRSLLRWSTRCRRPERDLVRVARSRCNARRVQIMSTCAHVRPSQQPALERRAGCPHLWRVVADPFRRGRQHHPFLHRRCGARTASSAAATTGLGTCLAFSGDVVDPGLHAIARASHRGQRCEAPFSVAGDACPSAGEQEGQPHRRGHGRRFSSRQQLLSQRTL